MESFIELKYVVGALVFSLLGIIVLSIAMIIFDKLTPGCLWNEIIEKQNVALALVVGATALGIAQIIASAIHG